MKTKFILLLVLTISSCKKDDFVTPTTDVWRAILNQQDKDKMFINLSQATLYAKRLEVANLKLNQQSSISDLPRRIENNILDYLSDKFDDSLFDLYHQIKESEFSDAI